MVLKNQLQSIFTTQNILKDLKCCVVIPVKDEEDYIAKTLNAFTTQINIDNSALDNDVFEVLVLANNCTDHSVQLITDFQLQFPNVNLHLEVVTIEGKNANIGFVRKLLMENAFHRLSKNGGGIILTTDADTVVNNDWIAQTIFEIENGADAVGGRILLIEEEVKTLDESTRKYHFKDEEYQLLAAELEAKIIHSDQKSESWHHQHFNGSFAVTTEYYERAGGSPDVTHLEDCAFFEQLQKIDANVCRSNRVIVHTSARCVGRTEVGLSYQLNAWKDLGIHNFDHYVESGISLLDRFNIKRKYKDLWVERHLRDFDFQIEFSNIAPDFIYHHDFYDAFYDSIYFGTWYAEMMIFQQQIWWAEYPSVALDEAVLQLKSILEQQI